MTTRMRAAFWRTVIGLTMMLLALPGSAPAQSRTDAGLIRVIEMEVRPEQVAEWAQMQQEGATDSHGRIW